jgi:hypothetical protein
MAFIEWVIFNYKRRNLIVREKTPDQFYLNRVEMALIEWELFHDKRRQCKVYESLAVDFIFMES